MADNLKKLKIEYDTQSALAGQFAAEIVRQIEALTDKQDVTLGFPIQSRVKTWASIEEKITRVGLKLNSLSKLQDLIGLRITLTFLRDVEKVRSLIEETFDVVKTLDTSDRLSSDQFGYSSIHILVKCPKSWASVPSLSHLANFTAEVQVRTLAQHIWAEVSHQLQYKNEGSVPDEVLRSISRSSALLETVDLEFERVLGNREEYKAEIKKTDTIDKMSINSDNLALLFDEIMPAINSTGHVHFSDFINDCKDLGVSKISELRKIIDTHRETMMNEEKQQVATINVKRSKSKKPKSFVFYNHVGLARKALGAEFGAITVNNIVLKNKKR